MTEIPNMEQTTVDSSNSLFENENGVTMKYGMPVVLVVGCLGNLVSFLMMLTKEFRTKSTGVYMATLAVVDTLSLLVLFNEQYLRGAYQVTIPGPLNMCNGIHFLYGGTLTASAWILVGITIDRTIAVFVPIKSRLILTPSRAGIAVTLILFVSFGIYIYALVAYESSPPTTVCDVRPGHVSWYTTGGIYLIFMIAGSMLPIILICSLNIAIMVQLKRQTIVSDYKNDSKSRNNVHRVTALVLIVSTTFVVLTLPNNIITSLRTSTGIRLGSEYSHELILDITELMNMANQAINFFLYVGFSERFRQSLVQMVRSVCTTARGERRRVRGKMSEIRDTGISTISRTNTSRRQYTTRTESD